MVVKFYEIDDAKFQEIATVAYEAVIHGLVAAGEMTKQQGDHILETYALVRAKKGWFGKSMDRLMGSDSTEHAWMAKLVAVNLEAKVASRN